MCMVFLFLCRKLTIVSDLNPGMFPLNTNTYPVTRGMRVQSAGIIVGCFIGIVSQIRLWRVISGRKKSERAAKEDEEEQRGKEEDEAGKK